MLCLLQAQDHCHHRGRPWGCLGLHSRDQDFSPKPKCPPPRAQHGPSKRTAVESRGSPPTYPVDKAPESQNHYSLQWKRQETSRYLFLYKANVYLSHHLRQPLCQVGPNSVLFPAPFSLFSVFLDPLALAQEGHGCLCSCTSASDWGQLQWTLAFPLFDWQLSAGLGSCATNSAQEVLHREAKKTLLKKLYSALEGPKEVFF